MKLFSAVLFLALSHLVIAQTSINGKSCIGTWKTIDDETGRTKSKVRVFHENGRIYGQITELLDPQTLKESGVSSFEEVICDDCPKEHGQGKPVLGLQIIWDMSEKSDKWADGEIMDPKNGKVYGCTMWLDEDDKTGNTLKVRGWLAFFYRTQTWYRVE